ncbi:MAG TPA: fused MFS/spermidine synthase [Candidatus Angelobacter sp.]
MSVGEQLTEIGPVEAAEAPVAESRAARWLFGATIFLSAFLLFLVQPILGKIILPWFGGSAGVWAACLLYFQASLLVGYAYAHCLRRYLSSRRQMQVHILLLAVSIALLPILPSPSWRNLGSADPAIRILGLLAATVGLPYLLVCTTSPLIQSWYAAITPGQSAYRFYALSNLGSMLGLISFPVLVEPRLTSHSQAWGWSGAYVVFVVLCAMAAWYGWKRQQTTEDGQSREELRLDWKQPFTTQVLWVALAACGAAMMMAVTNYLSQNIAPIPLLWILPLGLYLFSFVLCFDTERIYKRVIWIPAMMIGLSAMAFVMFHNGGTTNLGRSVPAMLAGLFCCCMVCHGELTRNKPPTRFLTYFYLLVSAGGVLGGFFVAIVAPHIFKSFAELPILMAICAALAAVMAWKAGRELYVVGRVMICAALLSFTVGLSAYMAIHKHRMDRKYDFQVRNFYGVLQVRDLETGDEDGRVRSLIHGIIEHGAQVLDPNLRREPTLYYIRTSGVGLAIEYLKARSHHIRVGTIGLGAGVVASYCRVGDVYRFYEINPEVVKIANSRFTFLEDCRGKLDVLLGDARLTLEKQEPQDFDLLAVDAFSGDAIPVHLITREAFVEYFRHLDSNGILAIHVSNKYLDLVPVVARIAENLGKHAIGVYDTGLDGSYPSDSDWVLVANNAEIFDDKIFEADSVEPVKTVSKVPLWTDNYSNVLQILDLKRVTAKDDDENDEEP